MEKRHTYSVNVTWTGNTGRGTASYKAYARDHAVAAGGKPPIAGSSDASFRGDAARWNPEELLVASLSTCHQLWYLHLCADAGVVVLAYTDDASGTMLEEAGGAGRFERVTLRPHAVLAAGADVALARHLHDKASAMCFVARSVNFPVAHEPVFSFEAPA